MFFTGSKVCVDVIVAFLFTSFTTGHAFQVIVHHFLPLALRVALCLAVASDCEFFHCFAKFYVYLTAAPGGIKSSLIYFNKRPPRQCPVGDQTFNNTARESYISFCLWQLVVFTGVFATLSIAHTYLMCKDKAF